MNESPVWCRGATWGYQNNYEEGVVEIAAFRDVSFDATQYESVLRGALDRLARE